MKASSNNPKTNQLGSGLKEKQILDAIKKSGYPLQKEIANLSRRRFFVTEEWTYNDPDSQELRAIDMLATMNFTKPNEYTSKLRLYPNLALIIECKKSDLPYIFFLCPKPLMIPNFPIFAGLKTDIMQITTNDSASSWQTRIVEALSLSNHQFFQKSECCNLFAKCVRTGKKIKFSGTESFHGIILPTLKAMRQLKIALAPKPTTAFFHFHMIIGIGVIDAPMIAVEASGESPNLTFMPWIRVIRHEMGERPMFTHSERLFAIEIVHKDFFQEYLDKHLLPFAEEFSKLAKKHQKVLTSGQGFAKDMNKYNWHNLESRLQEKKIRHSAVRIKMIIRNLIAVLAGRKPPYSE